jgi:hypothetical protein
MICLLEFHLIWNLRHIKGHHNKLEPKCDTCEQLNDRFDQESGALWEWCASQYQPYASITLPNEHWEIWKGSSTRLHLNYRWRYMAYTMPMQRHPRGNIHNCSMIIPDIWSIWSVLAKQKNIHRLINHRLCVMTHHYRMYEVIAFVKLWRYRDTFKYPQCGHINEMACHVKLCPDLAAREKWTKLINALEA